MYHTGYTISMHNTRTRHQHNGWIPIRRSAFLGALRVGGNVRDACTWVGMSAAGVYALARRDPDFAAQWNASLAARDVDRRPAPFVPFERLDDDALIRRLRNFDAARHARPRGIVAQQNTRPA